jgi:lipoate synthase
MKILEHNVETGEVKERDATAAEIAETKASLDAAAAFRVEAETKAIAKSALLTRLGITADEAALLLQ